MLLSGLASAGALIVLGLLFARPQLGIVALAVSLAVVRSLSRSEWLALVLGHGVYFMYVNRRLLHAGRATLIVALTVGFPLLPGLVRDRIGETYHRGSVVPCVGCVELRSLSRGPCG